MSFKIAAASSDGVNVDQHFGHAENFYIYEVNDNGSYRLLKINSPPESSENQENFDLKRVSGEGGCGSGCGGGGCHGNITLILNTDFLDEAKYVLAAKIGKGIEKALLKNNITAFAVELPIEQAINKIIIYENRLNKFK